MDKLTALYALDAQRQREATERAERAMTDARRILDRQQAQAAQPETPKAAPTRRTIRIERSRPR